MKKILVPIDFSETALNALDYSAELALHTKAELLLFHCFYVPEFVHGAVLSMDKAEITERECREHLERLKASIQKKHDDINISTFCSHGITIDEINNLTKKEHADLIIIGAHGAGYLEEKLIGSTASALIHEATVPVLVIDRHVKFTPLKNIVLASDFAETDHHSVLKPLKKLVTLFQSHLCI